MVASSFQLDYQLAQRQLSYLNYNSNSNVYLRFFYHSDDPRKDGDKGRKMDRLDLKVIENYQKAGRGVYVVVNGAGGGHEDKDIQQCCAIFCEWDDRPIEEQLLHWETVGFLEPTFTIYSGDKSAQPYWVFEQPITVEAWRELQCLLIKVMKADVSNKNPSRVFRLAGGWHVKPGRKPVRTEIVQDSGNKYNYAQVRQELLRLHQQLNSDEQPSIVDSRPDYEQIGIPVSATVPLEVCLSRDSRQLLESGMSEGGRNTNGAKLARDLIGTASYLRVIGQRFDGDPRQLLEHYANRCSPPLPIKEVEAIWKSAQKGNPTPSCRAEGVDTCIRAWYWKHHVKSQPTCDRYRTGHGFGNTNSQTSRNTPRTAASLCDRIQAILVQAQSDSEIASTLMDLATATGRSYSEINQLAKIIRTEGEQATEVIAAAQSLQAILKTCRNRLDLSRYLEKPLFNALSSKATAMPTAIEYLFNTLLAASASRIGTAARVVINPEGGYVQPCIFWTANVAHSGQAKTPPQQEIIKPLEAMEAAAKELHDVQVENYENDDDGERKPPVRQRRLLNNVTTSTKIRIHEENPRGLLEYLDELVADYQRLNQFKNGKGDDLQLELSFWNGAGSNFDRHDARLFLARTAFSKTGTYQWDTLARLMNDEVNFIASGYSSRFLYCSVQDAPPRFLDLLSPRPEDTFAARLSALYAELEQLPSADYLLSREAKVLFQGWNHTLVQAEIEENHFGLSLVYAKIESYTARIALWLHIVNAVLRGEQPTASIAGETMQHAIEIASFYLTQHKLIHAHNAPNRNLEGLFLKVHTAAEKFCAKFDRGVSASFLKTRINALKSWTVEKIRTVILKPLAAAGHGQVEGEGSDMVYVPSTQLVEPVRTNPNKLVAIDGDLVEPPISQTFTQTTLQTAVGDFDDLKEHNFAGDHSNTAPHSNTPVSIDDVMGDTPTRDCPHRTLATTRETRATQCPHREMFMGEAPKTSLAHHLTNSDAVSVTAQTVETIDGSTNSSPITPTTWEELSRSVGEDTAKLQSLVRTMAKEQRQMLPRLLATYLCQTKNALTQLMWVPSKLRDEALKLLTFTLQRIGGNAYDLADACVEYITGCKFISVAHLGLRYEQWVFETPEGIRIPIFGVDAISAIEKCAV